jgi:alpha-tubulin suppressor-like RCC1 family protein
MNQGDVRVCGGWAWLLLCWIALAGRVNADSMTLGAGWAHTCALLSDGSVRCWGSNYDSQLGDGTATYSSTPVTVLDLGGTGVAIATGSSHMSALLADGSVRCWGDNYHSQIGDGTTTDRSTPVLVSNLGGTAVAIAAGDRHTCALLSDGPVRCWGGNGVGQLGDGTTTSRSTPVSVSSLGGTAVAIAAGSFHTCALLSDGSVQCWGGTPLQVL